jgi:hypothetical protein
MSNGAGPWDPTGSTTFPNGGGQTPLWPGALPTPAQLQKVPNMGFDWEGSLSFQPTDTDWVLKAGIRYGRASHNKHFHKSVVAGTKAGISASGLYFGCSQLALLGAASQAAGCYHGMLKEFDDSQNVSNEEHMMLDFTLGKDVGLGTRTTGTIAAGVRIAQFHSDSSLTMGADPHYHLVPSLAQKYHEIWEFDSTESRSFHGIGPEVTWDGSTSLTGNDADGEVTLDWGVNASILFGRQRAALHHAVSHCRIDKYGALAVCEGQTISGNIDGHIHEPPDNVNRSRIVAVPNLGGYVGASVRYHNSKISLGYRADTFFGAMDGGEEAYHSTNRGFYGPYLNVSLGLGG